MAELYGTLIPDFRFEDARGSLTQLVHQEWQQVNVLDTRAGVVRGGHYHEIVREAFFVVSGSVCVTLRRDRMHSKKKFLQGDFFVLEPGTVHSLSFPEDCILVALYDQPVERDDGSKDIIFADI